MAKSRVIFRCTNCGGQAPRWEGRCSSCGEWNTLEEESLQPPEAHGRVAQVDPAPALPIAEVDATQHVPRPTGVGEFDRVLGGGLVAGSTSLLGGEPGIGKSTLLLQAAAGLTGAGATVLYISAEEGAAQVRQRAERLGALRPRLLLSAESRLPVVAATIAAAQPDVVIVDSVQTVYDPEVSSAPGSVVQVRGVAHDLARIAAATGTAIMLVGHVTKDGSLAGPRALEHLVDTVLSFEGDRHHALRFLRAVKHRYGPTDELGVFEMGGTGLQPVEDAAGLFLADRRAGVAGSVVAPLLDGARPLLVELQALTVRLAPGTQTAARSPFRSAQGFDRSRLDLLLAVLQQRAGISSHAHDVFVSGVGGARLAEPGADLAVMLAVASSLSGDATPSDLVVFGEVGLAGEVRQVRNMSRRLAEAARLGFTRALVPVLAPEPPPGIEAVRVATVAEAVAVALPGGQPPGPRLVGR